VRKNIVQNVEGNLILMKDYVSVPVTAGRGQPSWCSHRFGSVASAQRQVSNWEKRLSSFVFLFFYYYFVCEAIGTAATPGPLCQPRVIMKMIVK
jgi:hypothetical protein